MEPPSLAITKRIRSTPWSSRVESFGVKAYTVYNHMLLPTQIRGVEDDYHHLRSAVQVWDVACERQAELRGPDAARLAQLLTVRDLRALRVGRCAYAPMVDDAGRMINDPVALKLADDHWWFSVSDSDVVLWAGGLARGMGLDVEVREPDVNPLAVQGPKAETVMSAVFGDAVRDIKFFGFERLGFHGRSWVVARSGWSAQGGFEIYVDDDELGGVLYDELMAAGKGFDIGPGCPNLIERIEAGLFTYGTDVTRAHTALEASLDRYLALDAPIDAIGLDALRAERAAGVAQRLVGLTIDGDRVAHNRSGWDVVHAGDVVGSVTSAVWSPRLATNVSLGMVRVDHTSIGAEVIVLTPDGERRATVAEVPFPGSSQR